MPDDRKDLASKLVKFSEESGRSHGDIAQALTLAGAHPSQRNVTKTMVYNYANGITKMPGWFVEGMDRCYPGWDQYSLRSESTDLIELGGQTGAEYIDGKARFPSELQLTKLPMLYTISNTYWTKILKFAAKTGGHSEDHDNVLFPSHLLRSTMMFGQRVDQRAERLYSPMFRVGDLILLDPTIYPVRNTLHAITYEDNPETEIIENDGIEPKSVIRPEYAVCADWMGETVWMLRDGTIVDYEACTHHAAVVGLFPQYSPGRVAGTINDQGLDAETQFHWPLQE